MPKPQCPKCKVKMPEERESGLCLDCEPAGYKVDVIQPSKQADPITEVPSGDDD